MRVKIKFINPFLRRLIEIITIAGLYYLTARLGFILALPPGNVTPLWIPSGLGLAAVLVWGWPVGIGVFAGSFLANQGVLANSPNGLTVSAQIAVGSTLQAWLGAWLLRRFVGTLPPESVRKTGLAIGLILLSNLLAAGLGVTILCSAGLAAWSSFANLYLTWWVGDTIGILAVAPFLIVLDASLRKQTIKEPYLWPLASIFIGLGFFSAVMIINTTLQQAQDELDWHSSEISGVLQSAIADEIHSVRDLKSFFEASTTVTRPSFSTYTNALLTEPAAVSGFEWLPVISRAERAGFEQSLRNEGYPGFTIFEKDASGHNAPAAERDQYFPVEFIEPFTSNHAALGFDLGSNQIRLETIRQAVESGQPAASAPIELVQETVPQPAVLILAPVYRAGAPATTPAERSANLRGLVLGVYRVGNLVNHAYKNLSSHDLELYIYDFEDQTHPQFIWFAPSRSGSQTLPAGGAPAPEILENGIHNSQVIKVANRSWLIVARPGPADPSSMDEIAVLMCLLVSFGLALSVLGSANSRQRSQAALVRSESEFRALSDNALTGVMRLNLAGEVLYANPAAAQMFGFGSSQEFTGQNLGPFLGDINQSAGFFQRVRASESIRDLEIEILNVAGQKRSLLISASLNQDLLSATLVDISERKQAEEMYKQSQASLELAQSVAHLGSWERNVSTNQGSWSKEMFQLFQRDPTLGVPDLPALLELVHPNDRQHLLDSQELALVTCEPVTFEYRTNPERVQLRYFEARLQPVMDEAGELAQLTGTLLDITARRQMESEIRQRVKELTCLYRVSRLLEDNSASEDLLCRMILENLAQAMQFPGLSTAQIELDGRQYDAGAIPVNLGHGLTADIVVDGRPSGRLGVYYSVDQAFILPEEQYLVDNLARMLGLWFERRQAEIALRASNERFSQLAENIQEVFWMFDLIEKYNIYISPAYEIIWGRSCESLYQDSTQYMNSILAEDRPLMLNALESQSRGERTEIYYRIERPDGSLRWIWDRSFPIFDEAGKLIRCAGVATDITDLKTSQRELEALNQDLEKRVDERTLEVRRSAATYQALFENSNDGIFLLSPEGFEIAANQRALDMIGYTLEEWLGSHRLRLVPDDQHQDADQRFQAVLKGQAVPLYERTFIARDGRQFETEINLSAIRDNTGNLMLVQSVVRDISERKKAEKKLLESEERYRIAIGAADGVPYNLDYATDSYTFMGDGIQRLTGYTREEITPEFFLACTQESRMLGDLSGYSFQESVQLMRDSQLPSGIVWRSDFRFRTKSGEDCWLSDTSLQVRDEQGNLTGSIGILLDISDRKKAEEIMRESRDKLSAANIALERASRMKDEFLASMSHELRTPLTGILGLSEALLLQSHGVLNPKQLKAMLNIEKSGRHLLELINDILDLSKIEAGKLEINFEACSVAEICQASLQLVKGMAQKKKQRINFNMNAPSIIIRADARRLKQMLVNLLSNAIKFTPEGGQIGLDVTGLEPEKTVLFSVWDKGIGIQPEDLGRLFKPFVQLDSSLSRQFAGTGLGLSLVQRMADLIGGSVHVESVPGEGSRFTIRMPWMVGPPPDALPDVGGLAGLVSVLLVEDEFLDVERVGMYLTEMGVDYVVQPGQSGTLEKAVTLQPGAILLDINLQDGSGLDLLVALKAHARTLDIPVIICSVDERRFEAAQLGGSGYLMKPIQKDDLLAELKIAHALGLARAPFQAPGEDQNAPLVLVADDNEMILETIAELVEAAGFRVATVRSGLELLDLAPQLKPDIMLVDVQMPGLDGLETIQRLRKLADPSVAATPVIAVTALAMSGDRERCLQAGANEYMSKPISLRTLVKQVNSLLAPSGKPKQV